MSEILNNTLKLLSLNAMRYDRHNDLVVLSKQSSDKLGLSDEISDEVIEHLCNVLKCKRLAIKSKISNDGYRTPQIKLIRGDNPWVIHVDNRIKYTFDVTKTMFCTGNIKEKLRVSQMNCNDEIIVDMFAGIGYFTLPFLVHSNAKLVHSCEWNPNAVLALNKNLTLNGVKDKCIVHFGDNRVVCPNNVADRVYLGLIPSCLEYLNVACNALNINSDKLILHIHQNVSYFSCKTKTEKSQIEIKWANDLSKRVQSIMRLIHENTEWIIEILAINKIKCYAPHISHLVFDLKCKQKVL